VLRDFGLVCDMAIKGIPDNIDALVNLTCEPLEIVLE
jgi:hypothetical protein